MHYDIQIGLLHEMSYRVHYYVSQLLHVRWVCFGMSGKGMADRSALLRCRIYGYIMKMTQGCIVTGHIEGIMACHIGNIMACHISLKTMNFRKTTHNSVVLTPNMSPTVNSEVSISSVRVCGPYPVSLWGWSCQRVYTRRYSSKGPLTIIIWRYCPTWSNKDVQVQLGCTT